MIRPLRPLLRRRIDAAKHMVNPGSAPGMLVARPDAVPSEIHVMAYGPQGYIEHKCESVDEIHKFLGIWPVVWVSVIGLRTLDVVEKVGEMFAFDRLLLEDVLDTSHLPKTEYYDQHVFTVIKGGMLGEQFESEHLSIFLKKNAVVVFEEKAGTSFSQVRERIRRGTGKIRISGTDYLYYALLDEVIDKYFPVLENVGRRLSEIEGDILTERHNVHHDTIQQIYTAKSDLLMTHRNIWPVSDIISMLMREETPLISKPVRGYLRDCHDHSIQAAELTQFYRETASSLLNTFLAYEGHKTNEIVKVLTMVSAVFIPLNFVAGVYGMNFHGSEYNMPELTWQYGYVFAWGIMFAVAFGMLIFFRKRGWIGGRSSTR